MTIEVAEATTSGQIEQVRNLLRSYGVENGLTPENSKRFYEDLESLPGRYARPRGRLLLASVNGMAMGCGGLCAMSDDACEMKRMYVVPSARRVGHGKRIACEIIRHARDLGYRRVLLSTRPGWREAISMYRGLGFVDAPPFKVKPGDMQDMVFLGLDLSEAESLGKHK